VYVCMRFMHVHCMYACMQVEKWGVGGWGADSHDKGGWTYAAQDEYTHVAHLVRGLLMNFI
jgi:hypothetical protein